MLRVSSRIPPRVGLASSTALSVAAISAMAKCHGVPISPERIIELAFCVEAGELKTGAGHMDFVAAQHAGAMVVDCSRAEYSFQRLPLTLSGAEMVLVNTRERKSTASIISGLRERWNEREESILRYASVAQDCVHRLEHLLLPTGRSQDLIEIGKVLSHAHNSIAQDQQVVTEKGARCVGVLMDSGALGAKLVGAGGGGVVGLVPSSALGRVHRAFEQLPLDVSVSHVLRSSDEWRDA